MTEDQAMKKGAESKAVKKELTVDEFSKVSDGMLLESSSPRFPRFDTPISTG